jgi:LCP family protein required for cell wall assembly
MPKVTTKQESVPVDSTYQDESLGLVKAALRVVLISLSTVLMLLVITLVGFAHWGYQQLNSFTEAAGVSNRELYQLAKQGWNKEITTTSGKKNILILGVDAVANREGDPQLTDTILLLSLDTTSGQINGLSFPRDLWSDDYKTRINALYAYGENYYPGEPEKFTEEVISDLANVPIHHTLVLSLDQVSQLIDLAGGIEVDVLDAFTDEEFPRSDVDIRTVRDPKLLYETVSFEKGVQEMDGSTSLKFIRSRHSQSDQGTDQARSVRQQQVISSLISKSSDRQLIKNPEQVGHLYSFYIKNFAEFLPPEELIAVAKLFLINKYSVQLESQSLSLYPDDKNGVIFHPDVRLTNNQWIYQIRDVEDFRAEVKAKLHVSGEK